MQTYFCQNMVFLAILHRFFPMHVLDNKISMITVHAVSDTEGAENLYSFCYLS